MNRQDLVKTLQQYTPEDPKEQAFIPQFLHLLQDADCFERSRVTAHLTASAWIISPDFTQVLLLHHAKLNRWLQAGGHADGQENLAEVALREAREETGLQSLPAACPEIFDLDIHRIPARKDEAEHLHYDVRFLFTADPDAPLLPNHESKAVAWIPLELAASRCLHEPSIERMIRKTNRMRNRNILP